MKKNREDSKEESKVNKKINKPRIVICTILAILILVYIMHAVINLINNPTETFIIRNGQVSKEETEIGYIIRDETIVKGENYKNGMEPIIDEGQKTAKNEAIFRYYSNGEEELKKKIADLDVKIEEKMKENNQELLDSSCIYRQSMHNLLST